MFSRLIVFLFLSFFVSKHAFGQVNCDSVNYYLKRVPEAKSIQSLISLLYNGGDFSSALYMLEQQHTYNPEHNTQLNVELMNDLKSLQNESKDCGCKFPVRPVWETSNGPFGADATSFYEDELGNYWLGTGSSGGVYFSKDKGQNWEQRNNGIGPWHIADFLHQNDTLFIQVNSLSGGKKRGVRIYYYQTDKNEWIFLPGDISWDIEKCEGYGGKIYRIMNEKRGNFGENRDPRLNFSQEKEAVYTYSSEHAYYEKGVSYDHGFSDRGPSDTYRIFGFKEKTPALAKLNKNFPRDVFLTTSGNLYDLQNGNSMLLSKSGLYVVDKMKKINPLPKNGIVATDVRQVISANGKLYAMVNEADIWKFEDNQWIQIFSAYEHHLKRKPLISYKGYDSRMMNLQKDGRILFAFCGELWEMSKKEKFSKINIDLSSLKNPTKKEQVLIINSGGYNASGELFILVEDVSYNAEFRDSYYGYSNGRYEGEGIVLKIVNGKVEKQASGLPWTSFIFNDRLGNLWVSGNKLMKVVDDKAVKSFSPESWMGQTLNQIALKENGDMLVLSNNSVYEFNAATNKWKEKVKKIGERMNSISYGLKGEIIVGTGVWFGQGCDEGPYHGYTDGIFRWDGENWISIMGGENDWIYSMCIHPNYGLAVGTSGSGVQFLKSY